MRRLVLHVSVLAMFFAAQFPAIAQESGKESGYVWRQDVLPALAQSRVHVETGQPLGDGGCTFTLGGAETVEASRVVVRQLAVDFGRCLAITEVGVPDASFVAPGGGSFELAPTANAKNDIPRRTAGKLAKPHLLTTTGYTEYWYTNAFGQPLTKTHTDITWAWNGSCVTSTSGGGWFQWWDGWAHQNDGSTTASYICDSGTVAVSGSFRGTWNSNCYHWYQPATARGRYNGSILYGSYNISANCFGGYLNMFKYAPVVG